MKTFEYVLIGNIRKVEGGYNVKGCMLVEWDTEKDNMSKTIITHITQTTPNGWQSKKPVIIDIVVSDFREYEEGTISKEDAKMILEQFPSNGKVFTTWEPDGKAARNLALASHMNDPYDIG